MPDIQQFIGQGGGQASVEQPAAAEQRASRTWSEAEWREWNQWHWGWGGHGSSYWSWSSNGAAGGVGSEAVAGGVTATAAGSPPGDSGARDPLLDADPWARGRPGSESWRGARNDEKWWTSSKGDFADPPSWPGWSHYKLWRRSLVRWDSNTDVAIYRRAEKILKGLDWELQAKLDHLSEAVLSSEGYLPAIFGVLDVLAGEKDDSEKRRSIRAALYEGHRKADESLAQYALRRESQFSAASRFLSIPDELKAFMLEEQSGLTRQGSQNLRVLTEGRHEYDRVRKALQVLDTEEEPIFKSGGKSSYLAEEPEDDEPSEEEDDTIDEEIFLAIAEKDMFEYEALAFLAQHAPKRRTWSENKQLKAARKKDRRHFDDKSTRAGRVPGHRRIPTSELKKVTRCGNCGDKGHWAEDCTKPYRSKSAREKAEKAEKGQGNAFVFLGSSGAESSFRGAFLSFANMSEDGGISFLTLPAGHAIIDPGASQDLIGKKSFDALSRALRKSGLKPVKLSEAPAPASGVGGDARPLFNALVPCILGGKAGVIKLTVVEENIPQLLSVGLLEHAGAVIDIDSDRIDFKKLGSSVEMIRLGSGHRIIDVASWSGKTFPVPDQLRAEFQLKAGAFDVSDERDAEAYMALSECTERTVLSDQRWQSLLGRSSQEEFWLENGIGAVVSCRLDSDVHCRVAELVKKFCFRSSWLIGDSGDVLLLELSTPVTCDDVFGSFATPSPGYRFVQVFSEALLQLQLLVKNPARSLVASSTQLDNSQCCDLPHLSVSHGGDFNSCSSAAGVDLADQEIAAAAGRTCQLSSHYGSCHGRDNSCSGQGCVPASHPVSHQGCQPTRHLETLRVVCQEVDLPEIRRQQSSSTSRKEAHQEEHDSSGVLKHGSSCGNGSHDGARNTNADDSCCDRLAGHLDRADFHDEREPEQFHVPSSGSGDAGLATAVHQPADDADHGVESTEIDGYHVGEPRAHVQDTAVADEGPSHRGDRSDDCRADQSRVGRRRGDGRGGELDSQHSCPALLRGSVQCFTKLSNAEDSKCTEDQSIFVSKLNMPLVSYLLSQECSSVKWNLFSSHGEVVCGFCDYGLQEELCFNDVPEGREVQLTRKIKKQIGAVASGLIQSSSSRQDAPRECSDNLSEPSTSSQWTRPGPQEVDNPQPASPRTRQGPQEVKTQEVGSPQTASQRTRQGPQEAVCPQTASQRTRQGPQEAEDPKRASAHQSSRDISAAVLPSPAPGLSDLQPSPSRLSVGSIQGDGKDEKLRRLRSCRIDPSSYKILELFSPPRISEAARRAGFSVTNPSNFDKETGWDFFDAQDRAQFWKVMREQQPDCVLMTPECRPFSTMMESNWSRMNPDEARRLQQQGLAMLHFCVQVAEYQLEHGREFCLEHPGFASSSQTHAMSWLVQQAGVIRILFDQCMTELQVCDKGVSKKTTALTTNHLGIAAVFSNLQCDKKHEHVPLENGLPRKAQVFGPKLIQRFLQALRLEPEASFFEGDEDDDDLEAALDREVEASGQPLNARRVVEERLHPSQINKINQVHVNLGHISKDQMLALFKAAGAKDSVMRYVKDEYQCSQCMRQRKPVERKRATMSRTFQFNRHVGVDIFYISWQGTTHAFLNIICHGTNLQQVTWIRGCEAGTPPSRLVWQAFQQTWVKPFGLPQVVVSDGGSEFKDIFERGLEQNNVLQVVSDASSPWQNGKVERHGGWVKERAELELSSGQCVVSSSEELEELINCVVSHKNRWFSRGGFSPCQLVFGVNPNIPADLLGDSPQDLAWQDIDADVFDQDSPAQAFAKSHRIRQRARELCIQDSAQTKIRLSSKGRLHQQRQWAIGQWVYVWRKFPGTGSGHTTRSRWTGPGIVLLQSGHTVYVSMRSRLWKCNSDQLRAASPYESVGAALSDTQEMQEILNQSRQGRAGAVDVASEGPPPDNAEDRPVPPAERSNQDAASERLASIPEEEEEEAREPAPPPAERPGVGSGFPLRVPAPAAVEPAPEVLEPMSRVRTVSREEPLAEPAPVEKRRRMSGSKASSPESITAPSTPRAPSSSGGRVKREVEAIEDRARSRDQEKPLTRFEKEVVRDLQRIERESANWLE